MAYSAPTKGFSQPSSDTAMLFAPFRCTHSRSPCPTLSGHTEPTYYLPRTLLTMT